jgi:hypothetical protein
MLEKLSSWTQNATLGHPPFAQFVHLTAAQYEPVAEVDAVLEQIKQVRWRAGAMVGLLLLQQSCIELASGSVS